MTKSTPRISFLVPDIAGPVLGPVTELARLLQRHYPVEIVGPDFGRGVPPMYRDYFPYTVVPAGRLYRWPDFFWESARLRRALTGDVIVAVKAFADTVPLALWERQRRGGRVVVYLDEWDGALAARLPPGRRFARALRHLHHPLEECYHPWVERLIPRADAVLSTSRFLQKRFGGRIVHLGADTERFKPQPPEVTGRLRDELGLGGLKLIVFGGVLRPHKGCEQILEALAAMGDRRVRFVVVGPITEHLRELQADPRWGRYIRALGPQPKADMPRYLDLADAIALPLVNNLLAQSQVPCKIFEAMSMAKPIIASAVSDLPEILEGCGWVVPPDDPRAMAAALSEVFNGSSRVRQRAQAARARCVRVYNKEQTEQALVEVIEGLGVAGGKP
jgi:glycosyltransferase involved in cell wall biosynthesis